MQEHAEEISRGSGSDEQDESEEVETTNADDDEKKKTESVDVVENQIAIEIDPSEESKVAKSEPEQIPVLLNTPAVRSKTPVGRNNDDFDPAGLVSYLRTLPSEDLLLMSTHSQQLCGNNGPAHENENSRAAKRKRKKHSYQYDTYYMSTPDDITLCNEDLEKGLIR